MTTAIKIFNSPQFGDIRTAGTPEQPLFCLADVCKALGLNGGAKNVSARLDPKGVDIINTPTSGGIQQMNFITEPNLYKCIFQSRKKEAQAFQDWVTGEVLPSIRKSGGYMTVKTEETPEETIARALIIANEALERKDRKLMEQQATIENHRTVIEAQTKELKEAAPNVEYFDHVLMSGSTMTSNQVAKALGMGGAVELNKKLCAIGLCYRQGGEMCLYSPYSRCGLHSTRWHTFTRSNGMQDSKVTTVWTQKGAMFIQTLSQHNWSIKEATPYFRALMKRF